MQAGQAEDYSVTLLPNTARPTAAFTLQYQHLCGPVRVSLTNTSTGGATSYAWDFGDGSSASQASPPVHTYATPGVYEVRLVAQNAFGRGDSALAVQQALLHAPTARRPGQHRPTWVRRGLPRLHRTSSNRAGGPNLPVAGRVAAVAYFGLRALGSCRSVDRLQPGRPIWCL